MSEHQAMACVGCEKCIVLRLVGQVSFQEEC
ncbi:hypothetical protein Pla100_47630 [Neorhodopirellula pilleata]|uniref:Uncharacterized protein n=1 Tax=Neorhodopirellula pilleata TaxID=2714738 RepID=A0A5C5ZYG6_9BACT|nr:hypothetical protein Pla100_47630 [Neorhodopirellula pilleata]